MLRVYHEVTAGDLHRVNVADSSFVYTPEHSREVEETETLMLLPEPPQEMLRDRLKALLTDFQGEHGHPPGYVLFARQGRNCCLVAFPFAPPVGSNIVPRFDFEEAP